MSSELLGRVPALIEEVMERAQRYDDHHISTAHTLWLDYLERAQLTSRKPEIYAAIIEYATARLHQLADISQRDVASRHGVAASSVSKHFRHLDATLSIDDNASRYTAEAGHGQDEGPPDTTTSPRLAKASKKKHEKNGKEKKGKGKKEKGKKHKKGKKKKGKKHKKKKHEKGKKKKGKGKKKNGKKRKKGKKKK